MKNKIITFLALFGIAWYLNYCTPLIFDDYVYSFVWQIDAMGVPFPATAKRVSSIIDIFNSQCLHYINWGGRSVAHVLAQFFLWQGKNVFNLANAACFILLLLEVKWIIDGGKICFSFSSGDIISIFGLLWIFSAFMGDVFTWLTLSCNYLWTTVIVLAFLLFYERHYYYSNSMNNNREERIVFSILFFFFGIIAGWTNENVPCFVGLVLAFYVCKTYKENRNRQLLLGLIGFFFGYLLLMLAPGNYVRYVRQLQDGTIMALGISLLKYNLNILGQVLFIRFLLLYYVIRSIIVLKNKIHLEAERKAYYVSIAYFLVSMASTLIMIFSSNFRFRSTFPALVFLVISSGILHRLNNSKDNEQNGKYYRKRFNHIILYVECIYLFITLVGSLYVCQLQAQQTKVTLDCIHAYKLLGTENVLTVQERPLFMDRNLLLVMGLTGGHAVYPITLTSDKENWINKDVALYYGIKGIRVAKNEIK